MDRDERDTGVCEVFEEDYPLCETETSAVIGGNYAKCPDKEIDQQSKKIFPDLVCRSDPYNDNEKNDDKNERDMRDIKHYRVHTDIPRR